MHQVLWLPAHPSAGADSMDRYWRELERQNRRASSPDAAGRRDLEIACALGSAPARSHRGPRIERVWQKYYNYPRLARRGARAPGVETVHILDHSFAHLLDGVPPGVFKIVTVHDLAPLRDPGDLTPGQLRRFQKIIARVHRADLVIADSQHSADEAVALLGHSPAKTRVLLLGVNCEEFARRPDGPPPTWAAALMGRKVVLSVGHTIGRKNLQILPAVFRELRGSVENLTLLRVGTLLPEPLRDELRAVLGADGLVELGKVPDAELVAAYQRSDALLFPSRQEGFGFPVLEAMAAGCPVVCTDVTSLPEVGGTAALYFGPDAPDAAAGHLRTLLTEPAAAREARIDAGRRQAASLSWERHFERLLEIYRGGSIGAAGAP